MTTCRGLRLLLVGTYPPPYGGIASHLTTLIPGLKARGADDVAVVSFAGQAGVEARDGFTLYRFNLKRKVLQLIRPESWAIAVATWGSLRRHGLNAKMLITEGVKAILIHEVAKKHRSRVVSAYQSDMNLELLPLWRLWGMQRSIVLTVFGELYEAQSGPFLRERARLVRELLAAPVAVTSSSCHCARSFASVGVTRQIEPVYYGVELDNVISGDLRAHFRDAQGFGPSDVVVLFMSRLSKEMGLDVLLKAAPTLLGNKAVRLVIAGAKGDESADAAEIAAANPGRVYLTEDVAFSKQTELYNGADVLVAPSFNKRACMGMAIKEAMAVGLPVIGGAGGGVPEAVIDGETGFLVPLDGSGSVDVFQFTNQVLRLVNDAETRKRFGLAGRKRAEELFSSEKTNELMAQIFMTAMSQVSR